MKLYYLIIGIIILSSSLTFSTDVNGRFSVLSTNNSKYKVLLQLNTNTGIDDLGGATIVVHIDTSSLAFSANPINNIDYLFHNFSNGNYSTATITRPMADEIWINIDLPFNNSNNGTLISASPSWTDVVTINFDILDTNGTASITWLTKSVFWGIYDADNTTIWQNGNFVNLNGPLPVELISFEGMLLPDENILLKWRTASSLNNLGFEVEKSHLISEAWLSIGYVENQGDPGSLVEYSFIDSTQNVGSINKYRLKIIDYDGTSEYSNIIEVSTVPANYNLFQNYPNPFNPSTKIKFSISSLESLKAIMVKLKIYDILGNEITTLIEEEKEPGTYEVEFNAANLSSGIYLYQLKAADFIGTKKMVLIK